MDEDFPRETPPQDCNLCGRYECTSVETISPRKRMMIPTTNLKDTHDTIEFSDLGICQCVTRGRLLENLNSETIQ